MRVFISQPMRGRNDEEILREREFVMEEIRNRYPNAEEIRSFFGDVHYGPLICLGKSIELLAEADFAVFAPGWDSARGCRIEYQCCMEYDIPIMEIGKECE